MCAFVPEPDEAREGWHYQPKIDPHDFEDATEQTTPVKRGRKSTGATGTCARGHTRDKHGYPRPGGGGWKCRLCEAASERKRYHARKETTA
jgi:hypothetical protein